MVSCNYYCSNWTSFIYSSNCWRRHVELLQTSPMPTEWSFEDPKVALNSSVYPPVPVQNSTTTEPTVPVPDVTEKESDTSSVTTVPAADSLAKNSETETVSSDRRYPSRERRFELWVKVLLDQVNNKNNPHGSRWVLRWSTLTPQLA